MMQSPQTILREWLAGHPGDFTLRQASEATGLSMPLVAHTLKRLHLAEKVGTAGPFPTGERAQYHVGVWRATQ